MNAFAIITFAVSVIAVLLSVVTTFYMTIKHDRVQKFAQIEFMLFLLSGIFLVSLGSLLLSLNRQRNGTCIASTWTIVIGYTLQLVPLIVKASAIVKIVKASRKLRRVNVDKKQLIGSSLCLSGIGAIFCTVWTVFDPPRLQQDNTYDGRDYYCESESYAWVLSFYLCQGICNAKLGMLAYKMRNAPQAVSDATEIANMIYVSSIYLLIRFIVYILSIILSGDSLEKQSIPSFFFAAEMISNLFVYFFRFFQLDDVRLSRIKGSTVQQKQCSNKSNSAKKSSSGKNTSALALTSTLDLRSTKREVASSVLQRSISEGIIRLIVHENNEEEKVEESEPLSAIMNLASICEDRKEEHTLAQHRSCKSQNDLVKLSKLELHEDDESCDTNVEVIIERVDSKRAGLKEWSDELSNVLELGRLQSSNDQDAVVENEDEFVENLSRQNGSIAYH